MLGSCTEQTRVIPELRGHDGGATLLVGHGAFGDDGTRRPKQQVARRACPATDNEKLGVKGVDEEDHCDTQMVACTPHGFHRQSIALASSFQDVLRRAL